MIGRSSGGGGAGSVCFTAADVASPFGSSLAAANVVNASIHPTTTVAFVSVRVMPSTIADWMPG
jgi:hypothetical protein